MKFADHVFTVELAGQSLDVRVTADALHLFWGAGVGPQTAEGLVTANYEVIGSIVGDKILAHDIEGGEIVVRERDIDP